MSGLGHTGAEGDDAGWVGSEGLIFRKTVVLWEQFPGPHSPISSFSEGGKCVGSVGGVPIL